MVLKLIAQIFIQTFARAGLDAYQQAIFKAVNNPRSGVPHRMTLEEAKKILGVEQRFNSELIEQKTKHLINVNDPNKGGKILAAKHFLDEYAKTTSTKTPPK